jgi:phage-related protein
LIIGYDDLINTVPPCRDPGTFLARCVDNTVPMGLFFAELETLLEQHSSKLFQSKPELDASKKLERIKVIADRIRDQFQALLAQLRINRDLLSGALFRKERHKIYALKHELAKQFGIRYAIYRHQELNQWIVTHAFFKTTRAWPESEFDRVQEIMSQVKQGLRYVQ